MRKKIICLNVFLLLAISSGLAKIYANGGYFAEGNVGNGNLVLMNSEQLQIIDENLDISLRKGFAEVEVEYKIKNSGEKTTAKFGFPSLVFNENEIKHQEISEYSIMENSKPVKSFYVKDSQKITWIKAPDAFVGYENPDTDLHPLLSWYVSSLDFDKNETKTITIHYLSHYQNEVLYVSNDTRGDAGLFRYLISIGSTWKGPISKGIVKIHTAALEGIPAVVEPSEKFEKKGGDYVWEFKDLEPSGKDNITIKVGSKYAYYMGYSAEDEGKNIFELNSQYFKDYSFIASGSSYLKEASFTHLYNHANDRNFETAWVEGAKDDGLGEYILLTPRKPSRITHVLIANGFLKSKALYEQNNRAAEVEIVINDKIKKTFVLSDEFTTYLPDNLYAYQFLDISDVAPAEVSSVKVILKKVYKGSKYTDTAISEIRLLEKLDKKPFIRMSR